MSAALALGTSKRVTDLRQGLGFRGLGFRFEGFWVWGLGWLEGLRVQGLGVYGSRVLALALGVI